MKGGRKEERESGRKGKEAIGERGGSGGQEGSMVKAL